VTAAPTGPRVRFAPSPTGYFHVGGARTALYNWLFARQHGGTFVLRIEDTDRERSDPAWTDGILNALQWLGLSWDEGPHRQSERREGYEAAIARLLAGGHLYYCECSSEEVQARTRNKPVPGYDGHCRERGLVAGPGRALRFRVPESGTTVVHDLVRGEVEFANATIEDFIIVKSNGDPLFVLASVVDDMAMAITHVIRGEEHLPTTPKALLLYEALGAPHLPAFAHLPVLVNERRQKLSKRRDRVAVEDYREMGYLPEAMVNYLALVGWGPGDERELFSLEELVGAFRLEDVSKSPAFFDEKRLLHFNGLYLRALGLERFVELALPFTEGERARWTPAAFDPAVFRTVAPLVQARIGVLAEVPEYVEFLFAEPFTPDPEAVAKAIAGDEGAGQILGLAREGLATAEWNAPAIREVIEGIGESLGRKLARTQAPVRVATMGRTVGLPLFESLEVLGRERTLERLARART